MRARERPRDFTVFNGIIRQDMRFLRRALLPIPAIMRDPVNACPEMRRLETITELIVGTAGRTLEDVESELLGYPTISISRERTNRATYGSLELPR